ncbi:MAG TPA: hypothetical protein DDW86_00895 [Clostridiales bacterium]|nr:hypothetical protein [Clostridiales bacterium]
MVVQITNIYRIFIYYWKLNVFYTKCQNGIDKRSPLLYHKTQRTSKKAMKRTVPQDRIPRDTANGGMP